MQTFVTTTVGLFVEVGGVVKHGERGDVGQIPISGAREGEPASDLHLHQTLSHGRGQGLEHRRRETVDNCGRYCRQSNGTELTEHTLVELEDVSTSDDGRAEGSGRDRGVSVFSKQRGSESGILGVLRVRVVVDGLNDALDRERLR